jgi:uncharacterized protein (DUF849 family)
MIVQACINGASCEGSNSIAMRRARRVGWSTRVGLEDGNTLPDGLPAAGNGALVAAALRIRS